MKAPGYYMLQIWTLGSFEVAINGKTLPEGAWPRKRTRDVLKVLVTQPGAVLTIDQIIEALFPNSDPRRTSRNVQARISELRRVLEPDLMRGADSRYIRRIGSGYTITLDPSVSIDTHAFAVGMAGAHTFADAGEWIPAIDRFEDAIALYRGDFLADDRYAEWAEHTRRQCREQYHEGLSRLAECYAKIGRLRQAILCCQRILGNLPCNEAVVRQLMEYQDRVGQRSQALETFREGARALREHLDVDPSPKTMALRERIESDETSSEIKLDPRRLAVLPFANFSADPEDEYLAEGMTEELIGHLSRIRDLRVLARTSVMQFKDTTEPIGSIARKLSAGTLLEGSVRKADKRVRISAQLINSTTEEHMWAQEYSGTISQLLSFQQDVANRVARSLEMVLLDDEIKELDRPAQPNPEAFSLYLKGRYHMSKGTLESRTTALKYHKQALSIDPTLAPAYVGVSSYYQAHAGWEDADGKKISLSEGYAQIRHALLKALELDPGLALAHAALGVSEAFYDHDIVRASASFRRAIRLDPSHPGSRAGYCYLLLTRNRIDEAIAEARTRLDIDPFSPSGYGVLARTLACARQFDQALELLARGMELDASYRYLYEYQAMVNWLLWRWQDAERALEGFYASGSHPVNRPLYGGVHALYTGRISESLARFEAMETYGMGDRRMQLQHALALYCAREYERVLKLAQELLDADSFGIPYAGQSWLHLLRAFALERLGKDATAGSALKQARNGLPEWVYFTFSRGPVLADITEALIHIKQGQEKEWTRIAELLTARSNENEVASALAILHFHIGDVDRGFEWLNAALDHHDEFLLTIKTHPWFDPARNDPRFGNVLQRMNLAQ